MSVNNSKLLLTFSAKLEAQKSKAIEAGKSNKDEPKPTKEVEKKNAQLQKLSVATLTEENANKDGPITSKDESLQPKKTQATDSQLLHVKTEVEAAQKALLPNENVDAKAEKKLDKLLAVVQDNAESEASAAQNNNDDLPNEIIGKEMEDGKALPLEFASKEASDVAKKSEVQADAIIETESVEEHDVNNKIKADVTNEIKDDVISKAQSDVGNNVHLDVVGKPVIETKPSQVSVTFEMGGEANTASEAGDKVSSNEAAILPDQSVVMETDTSSSNVVGVTIETSDVDVKDVRISLVPLNDDTNEGNLGQEVETGKDESSACEAVIENQVVCEVPIEKGEDETSESLNAQDLTCETQETIGSKAHEVAMEDEDMSLCGPLVLELSEVIHNGDLICIITQEEDMFASTQEDSESREGNELG